MSEQVEVTELPKCDFCSFNARFDGRTTMGTAWANMCRIHFAQVGIGLGTGKGQRLILATAEEEE